MPAIPAICDTCGTVFSSGFHLQDSTASFSGNKSGPCPRCGGMGSTPDGIITAAGNAIRLIAGPARSVEQFKRLQNVFRDAQKRKAAPQQVIAQLKEEDNVWPGVAEFFTNYLLPKNAGEFWAIIQVLLAAIPLLILLAQSQNTTYDEEKVSAIVEKAVASAISQTAAIKQNGPQLPAVRTAKKIGRNEACPCASGKKYKRCCIARKNEAIK